MAVPFVVHCDSFQRNGEKATITITTDTIKMRNGRNLARMIIELIISMENFSPIYQKTRLEQNSSTNLECFIVGAVIGRHYSF